MSSRRRLERVVGQLTPKQLVVMEIRRSRGDFKSFVDYGYAAAIDGPRAVPLLDQIDQAMAKCVAGMDAKQKNQLIRDAQREGMFLTRLVSRCEVSILEKRREHQLTYALLTAELLLLTSRSDIPPKLWSTWKDGAAAYQRGLRVLEGTVRIIEREYFDGMLILFGETEQHLQESLSEVGNLIERFSHAVKHFETDQRNEEAPPANLASGPATLRHTTRARTTDGKSAVEEDSLRLALAWVELVKSTVRYDFGEEREALAGLANVIVSETATAGR